MSFLTVTDLTKAYRTDRGPILVLRGLSLSVERGEMVAIVGASGVGKSTLLHLLGGLDAADGGQVALDGVEVTRLSDAERVAFRNKHVGFVFQFHHLLPEFTALENAEMPLRIARLPLPETRTRAEALLDARRPGRSADASSRDAVRRRTAACGGGARAGDAAVDSAGRRADGEPG